MLYWPLYRQSVLPEAPVLRWFTDHRAGVENLVDGFWYLLVGAIVLEKTCDSGPQNWNRLSLLRCANSSSFYTLFFAEARYHPAIVETLR